MMNLQHMKWVLAVFAGCLIAANSLGQHSEMKPSPAFQGDSLSISAVIREVISNFPTVKDAEEALNVADAKIGLAQLGYYPDISADASYRRIGPVLSFDVPGLGEMALYPKNNYDISLNVNQTIYDFGKTSTKVDLQKESRVLNELALGDTKQKLALQSMSTFYTIAFLQEAIKIKDQELDALNEQLQYVQKKKETGSATQYQILSTRVKISGVESEKVDLQTAFRVQLSIMNNLLGLPENRDQRVSYNLEISPPDLADDSLVGFAMLHRDEMLMAKHKSNLAQLNYDYVKTMNNPNLGLYASGGWKNGYIPELNKMTASFSAGVGLHVPIFDAHRTKYSLMQAKSQIQSSGYDIDLTGRKVSNEVIAEETRLKAAEQKVQQFKLQYQQAEESYTLAKTNFKAGTITNLDLLDASNSVAESHLLLLKSRIDYVVSIYRLKAAIGQKLY